MNVCGDTQSIDGATAFRIRYQVTVSLTFVGEGADSLALQNAQIKRPVQEGGHQSKIEVAQRSPVAEAVESTLSARSCQAVPG